MVKSSGLQVKLVVAAPQPSEDLGKDEAPPRPAEPRNYTPSYIKNGEQAKENNKEVSWCSKYLFVVF